MDVLIERCGACGEIALRRIALGERPAVKVAWRAVKSETCDHMIVESMSVSTL